MLIENANFIILTDFVEATHWLRTAGAYRVATEVRKAGYTCQVIDCFTAFTEEEKFDLFKKLIGPDTLAVGLSSTFFANVDANEAPADTPNRTTNVGYAGFTRNYPYSLDRMRGYFNFIRSLNPKVKIILGGGKTLHLDAPGCDAIVTGMGDLAIVEYLKWLQNKNPFFKFHTRPNSPIIVAGDDYNAAFDFQNSRIVYSPEDNILPNETLVMEVGRGCIFKCGFCAFALNGKNKNDYIKDAQVVREELLKNYYEYGITKYFYSDDTHNDNVVKLQALADMAQSLPFELQYAAYLRIDLMRAHPEQYQLLKDGGLKGAFFGIESLYHPTLKAIGKGLHPDKVIEELRNFEQKMPHVGTQGAFICGLPHETKETITEWMARVIEDDFPLDTFFVSVLTLNRNPAKLYKSEFEKDSERYYTFVGNSTTLWHNGDFDTKWAWEFCTDTYKKIKERHRTRIGGWTAIILNNFGVQEDYTKKPLHLLPIDFRGEKKKLQDRYKQRVYDQTLQKNSMG